MIKSTMLALVTAVAIAGAAPAFAQTADDIDFSAQSVLAELRQSGYNATSVEQWGSLVRAYITLDDGRQVMQLFTPDTLTPIVR